jgi:Ni,Fe-hydrogenase I small subunit
MGGRWLEVLWLQSGGCGGCTMSLLCAESLDLLGTLEGAGIRLLWHPSLSEASGNEVLALLEKIAGGMNPTDGCGLQFDGGGLLGEGYRSRVGLPVINVAGCPTHPNWVTDTLMLIALDGLDKGELDDCGRPRFFADHLVHHGCPRNEFYEYKASAQKASDLGCLMEHLGCLGTQAHADCNTRAWNGEGSCTRGGYACTHCTAPEFEEPGHPFTETPSIAGIPVGLPTDMPKAWFVALASLSKAATPERLRKNATSDHVAVPPTIRDTNRR